MKDRLMETLLKAFPELGEEVMNRVVYDLADVAFDTLGVPSETQDLVYVEGFSNGVCRPLVFGGNLEEDL